MAITILKKAVTALALLAATPVAAGAGWGTTSINWSNNNQLVVLSNGQKYTKLDPPIIGDFVLRGWITFDSGLAISGTVKSWSAWPWITTEFGTYHKVPGLKAYKMSKSYSVGSRPLEIARNVEFAIPYSVIAPYAVLMCNQKANSLRDQGQSDKQIFAKNQAVSFRAGMHADVDTTLPNNTIWDHDGNFIIPVRCAKWTGSQIPQGGNNSLDTGLSVLSATLKLEELATANGVCRLKTVTALRANKAGETIKYRFFHSSGKKSAVFEVKTAANKIAVVNHNWDIPNGPGPESGWLRVEGVGTKFKTGKETYGMDCKAGSPGGVVLGN